MTLATFYVFLQFFSGNQGLASEAQKTNKNQFE